MSKYQLLPPLSTAEYEALREDIAVAGVLVPIDVDEHGEILDGHHRKQACDELGIDCPARVVEGIPEFAKADYALTVNLARRHLSQNERRQLVWNSVKDAPHLSDRQHARRCGVSPSTVKAVRDDLEAADLVSKLDTRKDRRGREQPATKTAAGGGNSRPADEEPTPDEGLSDNSSSAGHGGVSTAAVPGHPTTAAGVHQPADGEPTSSASTPAAGPGALPQGEADRPGPAVTPEDHRDAGEAENTSAAAGPEETSPTSDPVAPREREESGVSTPAPATDPIGAIRTLAEIYERIDIDVVGPLLTSAEMAEIGDALGRIATVVELLTMWHERTRA